MGLIPTTVSETFLCLSFLNCPPLTSLYSFHLSLLILFSLLRFIAQYYLPIVAERLGPQESPRCLSLTAYVPNSALTKALPDLCIKPGSPAITSLTHRDIPCEALGVFSATLIHSDKCLFWTVSWGSRSVEKNQPIFLPSKPS